MIYLDNGILVSFSDGTNFRFDPQRYCEDDVNLISHAHSDHLPSRCKGGEFVMSEITQSLLQIRKKAATKIIRHNRVQSLDAGHVVGSHMFLVEGETRVLCTGDFCTKEKFFSHGAKPVKTDILIIECTFGHEKYIFPDTKQVESEILDYIEDCFSRDQSVAIMAYPFGKAQEITLLLREYVPYVTRQIYDINESLGRFGYKFKQREFYRKQVKKSNDPFVLVTSSGYKTQLGATGKLQNNKVRTIAVSGWAVNGGYGYFKGIDFAFPFSDHADFSDLLTFVERCNPELVYTCHGFSTRFAGSIRKNLGIEAIPLKRGQLSLSSFISL
jgi:putative mRNA 3-end processing factor